MAAKTLIKKIECPRCGEQCREDSLQICMICRRLFCPSCAVAGYGRQFCAQRCREFFFHGDEEDAEEE